MRKTLKLLILAFSFYINGISAQAASWDDIPLIEIERMTLSENGYVSLNKWQGVPKLLAFWNATCPPCLEEIASLAHIAQQYPRLPILLIALQDPASIRTESIRTQLTNMPRNVHLLAIKGDMTRILTAFGSEDMVGLPYSIMMNAQGRICEQHYGLLDMKAVEQAQRKCK